jgi:sensor histidine kinase regulating citrate/malate metabolism
VAGNLVDNAFDAVSGARAGGNALVQVVVEDDAGHVTLTVRDNGPGVPAGAVEEIFRQGFSTKVSPRDGGRGFGLALSRAVCRRSGGDLTVDNDNGAVFTARFNRGADE